MKTKKMRAWNKNKKIMCYENEDKSEEYWDSVVSSEISLINSILKSNTYYEFMLYIGMKDELGKDIYEGDIVSITMCDDIERFEVFFDEETARFSLKDSDGIPWGLGLQNDMQVIGNIYENKDLLESA